MIGSTCTTENCLKFSPSTVVPTSEEKRFLKSEIKAYLDRAEEIALLSQVICLNKWATNNNYDKIFLILQKPTPRLTDQLYSTMSSTVNSSK